MARIEPIQPDDVSSFETRLSEMLAHVAADNRKNRISVMELREWTSDYLREYATELKRFPERVNEAHWGLFAHNTPGEDSVFFIVTFTTDQFGVIAGRANGEHVRDFAHNFDGDVSAVIKEVRKRFSIITDQLTLPISLGCYWIEYG